MKEFRKNNEGFFTCEECNKAFSTRRGIGTHIGRKHYNKSYYDKWLKENGEGLCELYST